MVLGCAQVACAPDLEKLCADVSKDHSHTLLCLRSHRDSLSKACKDEELRFSIMESSDIRLTPTLMNACGQGTSPPHCPDWAGMGRHGQACELGALCCPPAVCRGPVLLPRRPPHGRPGLQVPPGVVADGGDGGRLQGRGEPAGGSPCHQLPPGCARQKGVRDGRAELLR